MMAQTTFSIRMDEDLKQEFDELCSDFGMSMSTAMTIFAKAVVRERRIPFEISAPYSSVQQQGMKTFLALRDEARKHDIQDMSPEEIDREIDEVRAQRSGRCV